MKNAALKSPKGAAGRKPRVSAAQPWVHRTQNERALKGRREVCPHPNAPIITLENEDTGCRVKIPTGMDPKDLQQSTSQSPNRRRCEEAYESDTTPSRVVAARYRKFIHAEDHDADLALLSYRGGEEEFQIGSEYCASDDPDDRIVGADILAQLGWGDQTFRDESIRLLISLLNDPDPRVIHSAAIALGHRKAEEAIPSLLHLATSADPLVRYGVAYSLCGHEDARAIDGLIRLASNEDRDVRNWAVFGLGSQIDADSPEIRQALRAAVDDPDDETRGEALVGLAKRGDPATSGLLIREWENDGVSRLSFEAAAETRDPQLYHRLQQLNEALSAEFAVELFAALAACKPTDEENHPPK